ncbi:MAG: AAA family ATPase [Nanoarchaeota archaeon]
MKVINLFGGADSGKSTTAAELFVALKKERHYTVEMAREWVKDRVWAGDTCVLENNNQIYIFAKQLNLLKRLEIGDVNIAITDSPLLLSIIYGTNQSRLFRNLVLAEFRKFNNINIMLERPNWGYDKAGRLQTYSEALEKDEEIESMLRNYHIPFQKLASENALQYVKSVI